MNNMIIKVALVSGGSKGIGLAIAKRLLIMGFDTYICSRSRDNLNQAKNEIEFDLKGEVNRGNLYINCCDVTNEESVAELINDLETRYGYLNCLVNNSGGLAKDNTGFFTDLSTQQWLEAINTNLIGAVNLTQQTYSLLKNADKSKVINIASITAVQPGYFNPHYAAAKAGLLALSKNLSMIWADDGIQVNAISPGIIETEGWQEYIEEKAASESRPLSDVANEENNRATANVPLNRLGMPVEVAECVAFLASDASAYVTGSNIIIDGGKHRAI